VLITVALTAPLVAAGPAVSPFGVLVELLLLAVMTTTLALALRRKKRRKHSV